MQPAQTVTDLPGGGDVIAYQAVLADAGVYSVKVSPYLPQQDGPPLVTAWTLLVSTRTGRPLLLVDAGRLTVERTAATTAVAVDLLARPDARRVAVIGLGPVGQAHLRHVQLVRDLDDITVWSPSTRQSDVDRLHCELGLPLRLASGPDDAADGADVVLLCTSAAAPVLDVRRLTPGTLVTSVSTNAPNAHEIDPAALDDLEVYADHRTATSAPAAEMRIACTEHGWNLDAIRGDLPGLIRGDAPRPSGTRAVYFRSVGLGLQDAAVALAALAEHDDAVVEKMEEMS